VLASQRISRVSLIGPVSQMANWPNAARHSLTRALLGNPLDPSCPQQDTLKQAQDR